MWVLGSGSDFVEEQDLRMVVSCLLCLWTRKLLYCPEGCNYIFFTEILAVPFRFNVGLSLEIVSVLGHYVGFFSH